MPFQLSAGEPPVPAWSTIERNLIFADYDGVKGLDHDDGSSFFDDQHNVIYMGWGQKTFKPSPGAKRTHGSLILYAPSVLTEHEGEAGYPQQFYDNVAVLAEGGTYGSIDGAGQLSSGELQLRNNTIYGDFRVTVGGDKLSWDQFQQGDVERGSRNDPTRPSDAALVAMAKALLLIA